MAIGLGRMVGFKFPENFNKPYTAISVTDFWQRWHMTLSKWMLLYLYVPLGGNKVAPWRMYCNLWIVFLISGFWHGASWNFILWGAYFGFFLTVEKFIERRGWGFAAPSVARQLLTFLIIMNSWVLFRSDSLGYAMGMFGRMYGVLPQVHPTAEPFALLFPPHGLAMIALGTIMATVSIPSVLTSVVRMNDSVWRDVVRWAGSAILFLASLSAIFASGSSSFLYFRF
jgi:alginate O-acetyltransferase complex protein AlgI